MGYAMMIGTCVACGCTFTFNPVRVPSITTEHGKEPVCLNCINLANPERIKRGLEPIVPHPEAYTFCEESELE